MRPWQTWTIFGACLAVAFAVMGWLSVALLRLDRSEADARRQALEEENIRLALWRMDSALGPLIAQESRRQYFEYRPFYAPLRAYTAMYGNFSQGEILLPSPLMTDRSPYVLLHFQVDAENSFTSPQIPPDDRPDLELPAAATQTSIALAKQRLARLPALFDQPALLARLPASPIQPAANQDAPTDSLHTTVVAQAPLRTQPEPQRAAPAQQEIAPQQSTFQRLFSGQQQEGQWQQRNIAEQCARVEQTLDNNGLPLPASDGSPADIDIGPMQPAWIGDELLLIRRVNFGGQQLVQCCWLDRPAITELLLTQVTDLLPAAGLEPVHEARTMQDTRLLAALPFRLAPGHDPGSPAPDNSPIPFTLAVAWFGITLAAFAGFLLLRGTISLSERRAAFVSAVTHEMRTPLTTLRMYSEMLTKGMVPDESQRARYLQTLSTEANRLGYLVENVLSFARIENNHDAVRLETPTLRELLARIIPRLADRVRQAGMSLHLPPDDQMLDQRVRVQPAAVEHILFNLVDNACKYANGRPNASIHLEIRGADADGAFYRHVDLTITDNGPGVPPEDARRLFQPFCKSAHEAADTAPGIGLGLALSRRLARGMSGDLRLDANHGPGARFCLSLPAS